MPARTAAVRALTCGRRERSSAAACVVLEFSRHAGDSRGCRRPRPSRPAVDHALCRVVGVDASSIPPGVGRSLIGMLPEWCSVAPPSVCCSLRNNKLDSVFFNNR